MDLETLWQRMEAEYATLPAKLREAMRFIRDNPAGVALHSLRRTAREAGTSPGTIVRLLQTLGFQGWEEFQQLHRTWLTETNATVFSRRAGPVIGAAGAGAGFLDGFAAAEAANAASGLRAGQHPALLRAADLLAQAPEVGVLGLRSCHPVAVSLAYALSLFRPGVRLIGGTGGLMLDDVACLAPGAVLVAASVAPYSRDTVEATRHARDAGLAIVGLTDGPFTPVSRLADVTLTASVEGPAHIASVTGLVTLAQALATLTLAARGRPGLAALRRREAMLAARSAYLPPED